MSNKKELTIMQINDTHSYIEPHQELFWSGNKAYYKKAGGFSRISTILKNERKNKGNVLTFDGGDTIHGTYQAVHTKGEDMIPILNEMGLDAMTTHWEFAYGPDHFIKFKENLDYPVLAINCYYEDNDELVFNPYIIKEFDNIRVGVIGIAATIVDKVMPDSFSEGVYFTFGNKELPKYINKLKKEEEVDLIVVLSHLGFPQEAKLAREVNGIDVLLSGHTHNRIHEPAVINDTIIIQSGCHGSFVGRLDLEIENDRVTNFNHDLITVTQDIAPDSKIEDMIDNIMKPYRDKLNQIIGYTDIGLNRNLVLETTMDNFLLDSIIDLTGADLAFSNGWRYGAPIPKGPITLNDLWNIIPVNPPISLVELTGQELWDMMEENLERTFSRNPYNQMGGYVKRCMGLTLYFKVENPNGQRIQRLFINENLVDPNKVYKAAFVTTQGVPAKYGTNRRHLDIKAIENLKRYLNKEKVINPKLRRTIVAV